MKDRLKKIQRVVAVQQRLHQLAELRLAALKREGAEIQLGQEDLVGALNKDDAFHGLFVDAMARRLRVLAREAERVARAREAQHERVLHEAMRLKRTERMAEIVDRAHKAGERRRGFQDLLESIVRNDASFP